MKPGAGRRAGASDAAASGERACPSVDWTGVTRWWKVGFVAPDSGQHGLDALGAFFPGERVERSGAENGPLHGLRFAAKDNFDIAGEVTGAGNPDWRRTHSAAPKNAAVVTRLLDAGASLSGKTIMDELAYGAIGQNRHYGTPHNSAAPGRVPGGSSSGSASAVAGAAVDFALGTDSACSVRLPASLCGLYGVRPTHGRVSVEGVVPLSPSLDTVGWFSRSAEVLDRVGRVLLDPVVAGPEPTTVLFPEDAWALARPEIRETLRSAVDRVTERIGVRQTIQIGDPDTERAVALFLLRSATLQIHEVWDCHGAWIEETQPDSVVLREETFALATDATDASREEVRAAWSVLRGQIRDRIGTGAVLVLPTASDVAPLVGQEPDHYQGFTWPSLSLLSIAVLGGLPQVTLPVAQLDGLPVGLSLVGAPGADEQLLALTTAL